jgi:hypothetical protein
MKKIFQVTSIVCTVALVVVLQSGNAVAGFPNPSPPPGAGAVVGAVKGAVDQVGGAVSNLTADQQRQVDDAKREIEAQARAAAAALQNAVNQRVTQLNSYYNDQRSSRQARQKSALERSLSKKKIVSGSQLTYGRKTMMQKSSDKATTQQTPRIDTVSASAGEPGDSLLISGSGFLGATEVFFLVAPNRPEKGIVSFSNDSQLMVQVPAVTGIPAYNGLVYVRREDGQMSPGAMFRFTPRTTVIRYQFDNLDDVMLHNDGGADKKISYDLIQTKETAFVEHSALFGGFKVDDTLFPNKRLKNGWIVEDVIFDGNQYPLHYSTQLESSGKGTDSLRLKVHGWTNGPIYFVVKYLQYHTGFLIRGPEGLSYR